MESNVSQYKYITMSWYLMSDNLISLKPWLVVSTHLKQISQIGNLSPSRVEHKQNHWVATNQKHILFFLLQTFGASHLSTHRKSRRPAEWTVDQLPGYHLHRHPKTWCRGFGSSKRETPNGFLTPEPNGFSYGNAWMFPPKKNYCTPKWPWPKLVFLLEDFEEFF